MSHFVSYMYLKTPIQELYFLPMIGILAFQEHGFLALHYSLHLQPIFYMTGLSTLILQKYKILSQFSDF